MSIVYNGLTTIQMINTMINQCLSYITVSLSYIYTNDKAMSIVYNGLTTIQMIKQCLSYITVSLLYKW